MAAAKDKNPEPESPASVADGAGGIALSEAERVEVGEAPKASKKKDPETVLLERRLAEVEAKLAANQIDTHTCHMCHKPGATTQRGNTGEWFHGPCLSDYRNGKDPLPK